MLNLVLIYTKKCEFLIVSSRQRQKGAFTSSKKLTPSESFYYELVGIPKDMLPNIISVQYSR